MLIGDVAPQKGRGSDTERFYYFAAPVEIDDVVTIAWFNARKHSRGGVINFYEFGLQENAAQTSPGFGQQANGLSSVSPTFGPQMNIGQFLAQIKDALPAAQKVSSSHSFSPLSESFDVIGSDSRYSFADDLPSPSGHAHPLAELIRPPNGLTPIGNLNVGSEVVTQGGQITLVTGTYPQRGRET